MHNSCQLLVLKKIRLFLAWKYQFLQKIIIIKLSIRYASGGVKKGMKTIAVISDSTYKSNRLSKVGETIKKNILEVFSETIIVNNYFIDRLSKGDVINEDLIVVMAGSRAIKVKNYVVHPDNIIVVKRTFLKSSVNPLYRIPDGTDVLVVNDDIETVLDSISSLYHIGIKHVNLIPFEAEKDYHYINYVVSPSEPELIPDYIENVYDIGSRVIDIPTMLLIMSTLHIHDKKTQKNLYNYYQEIFSPNEGITENYNNLLTQTEELDHLLDLSHDGILLTNKEGKILVYNKIFRQIFDIHGDIAGKYLQDILKNVKLEKYYNEDYHDDLVFFKEKTINLEKRNIIHFNQEIRMYFCFQEVTYIKKLEQNLSQKLRQKGHIARYSFNDIIRSSKRMDIIIEKAKKIAKTDLTVLITGESGTGKEILAQAIHNASERNNQPFIPINSAALPDNLIESELFGYASGSFTGALKGGKKGLFEQANNGTIFLDEIGDMPKHLQSKLLRVLQERQITPVGSDRIIDIDVRIIAASHKNPIEMINSGSFRTDLFYRLNVFPLELPALRNRLGAIPLLLQSFTNNKFTFTKDCIEYLMKYNWPGNIRELHNIAQYIATIEERSVVDKSSLPYYLLSREHTASPIIPVYRDEMFILEQKADVKTALAVLNIIQFLNEINKTAGRKHILELLEKKDKIIQESYLRRILTILNQTELIITKKGRSGSYLTKKAYQLITESKQQDAL